MKKTGKVLCSSLLTIAVSASLICSSTLALFTSESKTNIAITSGKVDVEAEATITKAWSAKWETDGYIDNDVAGSDDIYTFTNGGTASYADRTLTLSNITPGDGVEFTINVTNNSTIAIKYQTVVTFVSGGATVEGEVNEEENDSALFRALEISVGEEGNGMQNVSSDRSTAVSGWSETVTTKGAIEPINVTIKFPVEGDNHNDLQEKSCKIAIGVYAVQSNGHDTTNSNVYFVTKDSNLNDVFGEAQSGDTVVLSESLTMPEDGLKIEGEKDVNVDLSGNTFGVSKENETSEDLVITEGSSLTVKDSAVGEESKFTVETKANSGNNTGDRDYGKYTTEGKNYTMKVEGTLNFEGVDVEVTNKEGDIGICVDGGEVNFTEGTELSIDGRGATEGYGTNGFGKGFYVTNGGTVNLTDATVESDGAVTSFIVGGGEEESTLNVKGGTYNFSNMYNSITHATFVAAFQAYENGTIKIEGAELSLTGRAVNQLAYDQAESDKGDTGYTNMVLISTIGGGNVDVVDSDITVSPELGQAFVAQTVCSYYDAEPAEKKCRHTKHRGVQNDAHVTFSGDTKIYLNNAAHDSTSGAEVCILFAASRNGKQITQYSNDGTTYYDETSSTTAVYDMELAGTEPEKYCTIKVASTVKIYFSYIEQTKDNPTYHELKDKTTGEDVDGRLHDKYIYDLELENFINRYDPSGVLFEEE